MKTTRKQLGFRPTTIITSVQAPVTMIQISETKLPPDFFFRIIKSREVNEIEKGRLFVSGNWKGWDI